MAETIRLYIHKGEVLVSVISESVFRYTQKMLESSAGCKEFCQEYPGMKELAEFIGRREGGELYNSKSARESAWKRIVEEVGQSGGSERWYRYKEDERDFELIPEGIPKDYQERELPVPEVLRPEGVKPIKFAKRWISENIDFDIFVYGRCDTCKDEVIGRKIGDTCYCESGHKMGRIEYEGTRDGALRHAYQKNSGRKDDGIDRLHTACDRYLYDIGRSFKATWYDCLELHKLIYSRYEWERIFTYHDGQFGFNDYYLSYLKLFEKDREHCAIYEDSNRNVQEYTRDSLSVSAAFYRYLIKNGLIPSDSPIKWMVYGKVVEIKNTCELAEKIADPSEQEYLEIFDDFNCRHFFRRPDGGIYKPSQKSLMVYEWTGRFVMFPRGQTPVDMGKDMLAHLTDHDGRISQRFEFLTGSIMADRDFRMRIESDWNISFGQLIMEEDDDGYDVLCFLDFMMSPKKVMRYKSLSIPDGSDGIRAITTIIIDAYLKRDSESLERYSELKALAHHKELCSALNTLRNTTVTCKNGRGGIIERFTDILAYIDGNCSSDKGGIPNLRMYLIFAVASSEGTRIPVFFRGKSGTIGELVRYAVASGTISNFIQDPDMRSTMDFIIRLGNDTGYDGLRKKSLDKFEEIYSKVSEFDKSFDNLLRSVSGMNAERGRRS